jgi:hypothetical protein
MVYVRPAMAKDRPTTALRVRGTASTASSTCTRYPWGRFDRVRTLLLNITFAQPLVQEYAEPFRGLGDDELVALADSFAFANCAVRESQREQLARS